MTIGRNELCPCGSGKKYKKCCLQSKPNPLDYMKQKLDNFHERIVEELMRHAKKILGSEALEQAADDFFGYLNEKIGAQGVDVDNHPTVFYPWFLFKWNIVSVSGKRKIVDWGGQSIAQSYLHARRKTLDPTEREYLESFCHAPFSFFEITHVEPGKSVSMKDLLLDIEHYVQERTASQMLQKGNVIFGSAFNAGGIGLFGAISNIAFTPSAKVYIYAIKQKMLQGTDEKITSNTLEEYDLELRELYFDLYLQRTTMPELANTDGEKISFHTLKYAISSPQKVFDALKGLTNGFIDEEELLETAEFDEKGNLYKVEIPWILPANKKHAGSENTVHGRLLIEGLKMTCEVNSVERAERLRAVIEKTLIGQDATYKTSVIQSVESAMNNAKPTTFSNKKQEELENQPEVAAYIKEIMRKHWEAWPDIELPILQGKTPRQAAQDELGRLKVIALLEEAEANCRSRQDEMCSPDDLRRLRKVLGL